MAIWDILFNTNYQLHQCLVYCLTYDRKVFVEIIFINGNFEIAQDFIVIIILVLGILLTILITFLTALK